MPLYEGISNIGLFNEKHTTIILDIGTRTTKVGFAGETGPRAITPTSVSDSEGAPPFPVFRDLEPEVLRRRLALFMHKLYIKFLLVNPKERRVVVVENLLGSSLHKDTIAKVLFRHFEVPSVSFVPSHLVSLLCLGISTGLVVDIGHKEATIIPVFEGVPVLQAWGALPLGATAVHDSLRELLKERASVKDSAEDKRSLNENDCNDITAEVLEEMTLSCCFVSTPERSDRLQRNRHDRSNEPPPPPPDVLYPLSGDKTLLLPGTVRELACEVLFTTDADLQSLPHALLQCLASCNVDMRRPLAANIVITGGGAMLRGLQKRLMQEIRALSTTPAYSSCLSATPFKIHLLPVKENFAAWLGGCILGSSESAVLCRSLTRDHYLSLCNTNTPLPDWCSLAHNTREASTPA